MKPSKNRTTKRTAIDKMSNALKQIARLDHSISVPSIGTVFRYEPTTPIGMAQAHVADIYGVPFAYPSTSGTTPLNVMALLCLVRPGDTVLIQRDSHISVLAAIIHAGLQPAYITPRYSEKLGVTMGITAEELRKALDEHTQARAVFLTYPNYFGIATDIEALALEAKSRNIPLVVDSAHGSHWAFHPDFPKRAEETSARIVTYSTHKTCPALGQGSIVLFNDKKLVPRFYEVVNDLGFVSTSFSSIILTALFNGIDTLSARGETLFTDRLEMANWARQEINKIKGLCSFGLEETQPGFCDLDPLRLTVDVSGSGLTGYEAEDILIEHGCYPEMGTLKNVLFLITLGIGWQEVRRLIKLLQQIASAPRPFRKLPQLTQPTLPRQVVLPREAFYFPDRRMVSIRSAVGKVSAETISAYPPGSAVIVAGEEISHDVVEYLKSIRAHGGVLKGASDPQFKRIKILNV